MRHSSLAGRAFFALYGRSVVQVLPLDCRIVRAAAMKSGASGDDGGPEPAAKGPLRHAPFLTMARRGIKALV
jgi:hypothetical protein